MNNIFEAGDPCEPTNDCQMFGKEIYFSENHIFMRQVHLTYFHTQIMVDI